MPILYAGDTNAFLQARTIDGIIDQSNVDLDKIHDWLKANRLLINIKKSKYIIFSKKKICENLKKNYTYKWNSNWRSKNK